MAVHKESYSNFIQIEGYILFQGNAKMLASFENVYYGFSHTYMSKLLYNARCACISAN